MRMTSLFKIAIILLFAIVAVFAINVKVLLGDNLFQKTTGVDKRPSAEVDNTAKSAEKFGNLVVKNFTVTSQSNDTYFHKGVAISTNCTLENSGDMELNNFKSVIRTAKKELTEIETKSLPPFRKIELTENFVPENSGEIIFACRGDIYEQLNESSKNDNGAVINVFVLE